MLFFFSLGLFLGLILYLDYRQSIVDLDEKIFSQMRLCSFDLQCPEFQIDFKRKGEIKPLFLYKNQDKLVAYFSIPSSKSYFLSISYAADKYKKKKLMLLQNSAIKFAEYLILIAIISVLFSLYALQPMKNAMETIEEFIKDLLHDFNTPMSSIILNSALLESDDKNRQKILRIEQSAQRILRLEDNLKAYLGELRTQKETFDLMTLIKQEQKCLSKIYDDISWKIDRSSLCLKTNKNAFTRIVSNILENALKYNKPHGKIFIKIDKQKKDLIISDTGIGIKNPQNIFKRFYTENERGTGIGLHIARKLCDELNISIGVTSKVGEGSSFTLGLKELTKC